MLPRSLLYGVAIECSVCVCVCVQGIEETSVCECMFEGIEKFVCVCKINWISLHVVCACVKSKVVFHM